MEKLVIEGRHILRGPLPISGSKNTALTLMAAAVLADGETTLTNVPVLRDISTFSQVLRVVGAGVTFDAAERRLRIDASSINAVEAPYELVKKMRASFYMLGALLGRFGRARVSLPGGCAWGPRPVDLHLKGMQALGAEIELDQGYVVAHAPKGRLQGGTFRFDPPSVGATVNVMLAAVLANGTTRLENVALEPDVIEFGRVLQKMGAHIEGLGTPILEIEGIAQLQPVHVATCPDRIELGTFMIAAAIAGQPGQPIHMTGARPDQLGQVFIDAFAETDTQVDYTNDVVTVTPTNQLRPVSIETGVYPGFPTDLQAQWTVMQACANGASDVRDTIYTDRFKHIPELNRLGIRARVQGDTVHIEGGHPIKGAPVMSTDLRASVSLVLAGLVAVGETHVLRIYHLDRGYENLEGKLSAAGIHIRREPYDEFTQPVPHLL
jgi:UDP-N-acetylglucosamine 1-carboxyvinyltransferase